MTSVADEGHLDPLAETSQRRSCQELRCLCKGTFECAYIMKISVFCVRALVFCASFMHPSISQQCWGHSGIVMYCLVMMRSWVLLSVMAVRFWAELHITSL